MTKISIQWDGYFHKILEYLETNNIKPTIIRMDTECLEDEENLIFENGLKISSLKYDKINKDRNEYRGTFNISEGYLRNLTRLIYSLKSHGDPGHSFDVLINKKHFSWDGDGDDRINEINGIELTYKQKNDINKLERIINHINNSDMKINEDLFDGKECKVSEEEKEKNRKHQKRKESAKKGAITRAENQKKKDAIADELSTRAYSYGDLFGNVYTDKTRANDLKAYQDSDLYKKRKKENDKIKKAMIKKNNKKKIKESQLKNIIKEAVINELNHKKVQKRPVITESQLKNMIKEAVINELDWRTMQSAQQKSYDNAFNNSKNSPIDRYINSKRCFDTLTNDSIIKQQAAQYGLTPEIIRKYRRLMFTHASDNKRNELFATLTRKQLNGLKRFEHDYKENIRGRQSYKDGKWSDDVHGETF